MNRYATSTILAANIAADPPEESNKPIFAMAIAPSNERKWVLISGVNGYIAAWTAKTFLDAGYNVRGTTCSAHSSRALLDGPLSTYAASGRFEVVQVLEITLPGAFDDVVKGCYAIPHTASPIAPDFNDPDPVIRTAVQGTRCILESAQKHGGSTLEAFVLLSSIAAVIGELPSQQYRFTESDWNDISEKEVARLGKETPSGQIYGASKTAAEKAMWEFRKTDSPTFTMTAISPTFVWGPPLVLPEDPENINMTTKAIWTIFSGQDHPPPLGGSGGCVDVRDVASLMLFAVQGGKAAGGQRYIASSGRRTEQAVADILREQYPARREIIKAGTPGAGYLPDYSVPKDGISIDSSKAASALGRDWIGVKQSVLDAAAAFERYI